MDGDLLTWPRTRVISYVRMNNCVYFLSANIAYTIIARREFIIAAVTLCVTLPLSLYRNISRLSKVGHMGSRSWGQGHERVNYMLSNCIQIDSDMI